MDTMNYVLFICLAVPVALMLIPIEKASRKVILALLTGMFCALFAGEINGFLYKLLDVDTLYLTTNITPIVEELIKLFPVLYYAVLFSEERRSIITVAFSVGVGFAMLENLIILTQHISSVNLFFGCVRGFSSGLMHSICVIFSANFVSLVRKKKKLFIPGTICALNLAIVYHSVFNLLVEARSSAANDIGFILPILTYVVINIYFYHQLIVEKKTRRVS